MLTPDTLSAELETQLDPQTTAEHLVEIADRGWSPTELLRLIDQRPLRGKGSRISKKSKEKEQDFDAGQEEQEPAPRRRGRPKNPPVEPAAVPVQETLNGMVLKTRMAEDVLDPRSKRGRAAAAAGLLVKQTRPKPPKSQVVEDDAGVIGATAMREADVDDDGGVPAGGPSGTSGLEGDDRDGTAGSAAVEVPAKGVEQTRDGDDVEMAD